MKGIKKCLSLFLIIAAMAVVPSLPVFSEVSPTTATSQELSKPINIHADSVQLSWDSVVNANSYVIDTYESNKVIKTTKVYSNSTPLYTLVPEYASRTSLFTFGVTAVNPEGGYSDSAIGWVSLDFYTPVYCPHTQYTAPDVSKGWKGAIAQWDQGGDQSAYMVNLINADNGSVVATQVTKRYDADFSEAIAGHTNVNYSYQVMGIPTQTTIPNYTASAYSARANTKKFPNPMPTASCIYNQLNNGNSADFKFTADKPGYVRYKWDYAGAGQATKLELITGEGISNVETTTLSNSAEQPNVYSCHIRIPSLLTGDYKLVYVKLNSDDLAQNQATAINFSVKNTNPDDAVISSFVQDSSNVGMVNYPNKWICTASGTDPLIYQFGWRLKGAQSWSPVVDTDSNVYQWTPTESGDYEVAVWVRQTGSFSSYDKMLVQGVTIKDDPVTIKSLSPDKASSAPGTMVKWTCNAIGGRSLRYQFYIQKDNDPVQIAQAYGTSNVFSWTPTVAGNYYIGVRVKDAPSPADYDSYQQEIYSVIGGADVPVNISSLTADKASATSGTAVQWTCGATGGTSLMYQYWAHKAGEAWQVVQPFGTSNVLAWTPASAGDYEIGVWVKDASSGAPYDSLLIKPFTATGGVAAPVSIGSLTADKASAASGAAVQWTCSATGGTSLMYQYWAHKAGEAWQVVQPFGTSNVLTWTPASAGDYEIGVWVKDASSGAPYDSLLIKPFTATGGVVAPVSIGSLTADKASATSGTAVQWTCGATGGTSLMYQYWAHKAGEAWQVVQPFGTSNVLAWTPASAGDYEIGVWVKDASSGAPYDSLLIKSFTATGGVAAPVSIGSLTADKASAASGTAVQWTCSATGGTSLMYQYWAHKSGEAWQVVQPFGTSNVLTWTPASAGDYEIGVWVKDASSGAPYDSLLIKSFTATGGVAAPVSIGSLTADKASAASGTAVQWTCGATGGTSLMYQYWAHKAGEAWQVVQPFGTSNVLTWTPASAGDYEIGVWVKDASSGAPYDSLLIKPFTATGGVAAPVSIGSLTADKASAASGAAVQWTCSATGGTSLMYQYWAHKAGEAWQVVQPFGTSNVLAWTPASAGDYEIGVWVKDASSGAPYDSLLIKPFTATGGVAAPVSIGSLTADKASAASGAAVQWTCSATGGTSLMYQYWAHKAGEAWQVVQPFGTSNVLAWTPASAGDYEIGVWVKDASSGAPYDSLLIKNCTVAQ